ncbi:hypothetical protein [Aureimonas sp. N4]|uniref:hypothetical protein n=1 Tax=Aureimonas sp. N4 TaxID=1638165 RepID=UPI000ADFAA54|nr:hypothetical protein [Aureimonas sp. N4]
MHQAVADVANNVHEFGRSGWLTLLLPSQHAVVNDQFGRWIVKKRATGTVCAHHRQHPSAIGPIDGRA